MQELPQLCKDQRGHLLFPVVSGTGSAEESSNQKVSERKVGLSRKMVGEYASDQFRVIKVGVEHIF